MAVAVNKKNKRERERRNLTDAGWAIVNTRKTERTQRECDWKCPENGTLMSKNDCRRLSPRFPPSSELKKLSN